MKLVLGIELNVQHLRIGLIAGLIAVLITTAINVASRAVGWFPEGMDLKNMADFFVNPARDPMTAFVIGTILHILSGGVYGVVYALLIKPFSPVGGVLFMFANWLLMMLVLFPVTNRGFFGLNQGSMMPVATLILNMLYGVVFGALARRMNAATPQPKAP
jgi:hypothetical protein